MIPWPVQTRRDKRGLAGEDVCDGNSSGLPEIVPRDCNRHLVYDQTLWLLDYLIPLRASYWGYGYNPSHRPRWPTAEYK